MFVNQNPILISFLPIARDLPRLFDFPWFVDPDNIWLVVNKAVSVSLI